METQGRVFWARQCTPGIWYDIDINPQVRLRLQESGMSFGLSGSPCFWMSILVFCHQSQLTRPAPTRPRCLLKASGPAVLSVCRCLPGTTKVSHRVVKSVTASQTKHSICFIDDSRNLRDPYCLIWFKSSGWHIKITVSEIVSLWKGLWNNHSEICLES